MKNQLKNLALFLLLGVMIVSCSKDEFTEEDALNALQKVTLQIAVKNASSSDSAIADAQIKAVIEGVEITAATNEFGVATIPDVVIGGNVNVYVSKENYTTVFTTINTIPSDYRQSVVSSTIRLYSLNSSDVATVTGYLTAETDLTNREREKMEGVEVLAYNSSLSTTQRYFVGLTDAEGKYEIQVPVSSNGYDDLELYFPTLEKERIAGEDNDNIYSVETKVAEYFADNYSETPVLKVPSTLIEITAPPASGSGFELGAAAIPTALSAAIQNEFTDEVIVSGGSGYNGTENFIFAADANGNKAELSVTVTDDIITSISIIDNGAEYTSLPDIVSFPANGSGAEFDFLFGVPYRIYIANGGSEYKTFPQVGAEWASSVDNTSKLQMRFDPDINSSNDLGGGNIFGNAFISNGKILVKNEANADTLIFTTNTLYQEPVFVYANEDVKQAVWYAQKDAVDMTDGSLTDDFTAKTTGAGYDYTNNPIVTVTALAGYGSGATVKPFVSSAGKVTDLIVMTKGSGYTEDINDYDGDGSFNEEEDGDLIGFDSWSDSKAYFYNVKPGVTYKGDVFYGTGKVKE